MKILTIASDLNHPGLKRFTDSLKKYGWEYEILERPFVFGGQMQHIGEWCRGKSETFIYCDAYDTICFGDTIYFEDSADMDITEINKHEMVISAEKNCYPHPELAQQYPATLSPWKFVNAGGFMSTTEFFTEIFKTHQPGSNDQDWLAKQYLANQDKVYLDRQCKIFQTIAFSHKEEWEKQDDKWLNIGTQTKPLFFHGNGHTEMEWLTL